MAPPETLQETFAQAGLTFRIAWALILLVVYITFMYLTGQSRFWASIGLEPNDGRSVLTHLARDKERNFYRFSVELHGKSGAPKMEIVRALDDWRYNLDATYSALSKQKKGEIIPIRWMDPRWGESYLVEIAGVSVKKPIEVFDILAYAVGALAPFVLLVLGVRVGFFRRPEKYKR